MSFTQLNEQFEHGVVKLLSREITLSESSFEFGQVLTAQMMSQISGGEGELSVFVLHWLPVSS